METVIPLGICILPESPPNTARPVTYPGVLRERLTYWGIPCSDIRPGDLESVLPMLRVLVTVGECSADTLPDLRAWLESGNVWIALSGTAGMPELLGVEPVPPAYSSWGGGVSMLGEGWMHAVTPHVVMGHIPIPLHYFNGARVRVSGDSGVLAVAERLGHAGGSAPAVVLRSHGRGWSLLIAPDVTGAVVRIRQGIAVTRDGVPAPDGTAPICDGVLKSDDGAVLDWDRDRQAVPGVDGLRAFLQPIADLWEEMLIRAVFWAATEAGLELPTLWLYPRNLPALAVLSHDSDGNDPKKARALLRVLKECEVRSTWCLQAPGYEQDVLQELASAGHELAMHYDAMTDGCSWSAEEFARQLGVIRGSTAVSLRTNKNHYLRWEGDEDLWEWCAAAGLRLDQSKGASKTGEAGFNFGTCHLYRPVRRDGKVIDVWEMPTPTQDLVVFAPPALGTALREAVLRSSGILHHLFHPAHIETEGVADALRTVVVLARNAGMEWWTAAGVAEWFDARVQCRWAVERDGERGRYRFRLTASRALQGATIRRLGARGDTECMGFRFHSDVTDIGTGESVDVIA